MMFQPYNETGILWRLENMVKTVAFLKPNGKIRNIDIEDVNKKVACITAFRAVEVNVTFYLVETFTSMNVQWQVAIGAVEVEIGATFHELSMEYIIQGPIVYILSNLGVWWWVSRWYRLLQWFSISRVRSRNSTFFSCYIRHNCS